MTDHAKQNAKAWLESIYEMVGALNAAVESETGEGQDEAREAIEESVLSVETRNGWQPVGLVSEDGPEEYRILLTTGGPALRLYGELNGHSEPESVSLQYQDWGTPWTDYVDESGETHDATLMTFVNQFYFGGC